MGNELFSVIHDPDLGQHDCEYCRMPMTNGEEDFHFMSHSEENDSPLWMTFRVHKECLPLIKDDLYHKESDQTRGDEMLRRRKQLILEQHPEKGHIPAIRYPNG